MKKNLIVTVVAVNLAVLLVLTILYPRLMVEPGALMEAHQALETDCFACHTPFLGSRPANCIQCHKPAEIGLVTTQGLPIANERKLMPFHQDLIEQDCVACHSDHKGVQVFHPIGQFSHALLQPEQQAQCDGCHQRPGDSLHRELVAQCSQCHTEKSWKPATLDHDRFFSFDENHQTPCETCHRGNDVSRYTCYGCHAHSRSNIRAEHVEEGIFNYENCVECHRSGNAEEAEGEGEGSEHAGWRRDGGALPDQVRRNPWKQSHGKQEEEDNEEGDDDD